MDAYLGEIRIFAGSFAPINWALCNGQQIAIPQNTALFSIIGTKYGGDGVKTFALPNLQNNVPMGAGPGPGLTPRSVGDTGGSNTYTLTPSTLPSHSHALNGTSVINNSVSPANAYPGSYPATRLGGGEKRYIANTVATTGTLDPAAISPAGTAAPAAVSNVQPYLNLNFIICISGGYFPPRG
jgi:microcystin-dependent protein